MLKQSYEVEVLVNGKPAKEYTHDGKILIEGRKGTRFSIRMRNNSYSRKLFVPTIDGLSIMNGEEGSYDSSGYIVQGNSSITIDGWRTSDKEVAEFYFSSPEDSYRKKMDRGNNLGVIGVAVFSELFQPVTVINNNIPYQSPYPDYPNRYWPGTSAPQWTTMNSGAGSNTVSIGYKANSSMPTGALMNCSASSSNTASQDLGTGWGNQKNSEVVSVNFQRCNHPDTLFEIHYNTREQLESMGINFHKTPVYIAPQTFPGQYCKPPTARARAHYGPYRCNECGRSTYTFPKTNGSTKYDCPIGPITPTTEWPIHECK